MLFVQMAVPGLILTFVAIMFERSGALNCLLDELLAT
jgi:hypothetical protein